MLKLKYLLKEFVESEKLKQFLEKFKQENPRATADEISDAIIDFLSEDGHISESIATSILKYAIPAIMMIYGSTNPSLAKDVVKKVQNKAKTTQVKSASKSSKKSTKTIKSAPQTMGQKMLPWIKKYAKQYGISEHAVTRLLKRETSFSPTSKSYNPKKVGDKGNELGPSYGAGQIKVVMAQEIYEEEPESDINSENITSDMLLNNVEFNVRTAAKILAHYFHKKFKKVRDLKSRLAYAGTAYNAGLTGARKYGISDYGRNIAGIPM